MKLFPIKVRKRRNLSATKKVVLVQEKLIESSGDLAQEGGERERPCSQDTGMKKK
jgi:hypothetical protein